MTDRHTEAVLLDFAARLLGQHNIVSDISVISDEVHALLRRYLNFTRYACSSIYTPDGTRIVNDQEAV